MINAVISDIYQDYLGGEHSDSTEPMQHFDAKANDETTTYLSDFDLF
jgi:hypothetical protein